MTEEIKPIFSYDEATELYKMVTPNGVVIFFRKEHYLYEQFKEEIENG